MKKITLLLFSIFGTISYGQTAVDQEIDDIFSKEFSATSLNGATTQNLVFNFTASVLSDGIAEVCPDPIIEVNQDIEDTCMAFFNQGGLAQSYKPTQVNAAGAGIRLTMATSGLTVNLSLWDGLPNAGGTMIASGTSQTSGDVWVDVYWESVVEVTVGNTYYLNIDGDEELPCVLGSLTNPYPDGHVYANNYEPFVDFDFTFRTYSCDSGIDPFPAPYCGPLDYSTVEPITYVQIQAISNRSDAAVDGSPAHEDFTSVITDIIRAETHEITLEGNTDGNFDNRFVVFIDWNQNGVLDDDGEVYIIDQPLTNSTGEDGIQIVGDINVPADALLGNTRMRVKKNFNTARIDPCLAEGAYGQAEDYTINVLENLGVSDENMLAGFSFYPNPTTDMINLNSDKNIESLSIYNLLGQQVFISKVGATSTGINVSHLRTGTYVMKVSIDGQIGTYKLIKQ